MGPAESASPSDGEVAILNCLEGDVKISFSAKDPIEIERARRVIEDMLRRGYSIFVKVGDETRRVKRFDPKSDEYVIAWGPGAGAGESAPNSAKRVGTAVIDEVTPKGKKGQSRIKVAGTKAVAVGMNAGG